MEDLKAIVKPLYTESLTAHPGGDPAAVMQDVLADDFKSIGSVETKGKAAFIGQVQFFWKLVPDLKWEIQEMLEAESKVIVRSVASGSPSGDFFGMPTDGSKSFKILTIDIHTVEAGKIAQVYHLEDWATAMKQLKG